MTSASGMDRTPRHGMAETAQRLLAAHHGPSPLVLPNAWSVVSARAVEAAGFAAVATSSRAIAEELGEPDDDSSDPDLVFGLLARIGRAVDVPVTADLQGGLRLDPADLVDRMLAAGIVGCNLEDTDHHGPGILVDGDRQVERLESVRRAANGRGVHVVINARVDVFIRHVGNEASQLAEALWRGRRYLAAGADCVYPIGLADRNAIRRLVAELPGPVNVVARRGGLTVAELTKLGVGRISMAGGIHQLTMADLAARLRRVAAGESLARVWPAG